ncbi:hypothetical protein [Sphingopyxis sp. 113P3]|uniref:hypothetical protein n=1 Tax=Sphingopyxis sp. (strain 113P3) TaxID=292913 RepID=UPI0006AD53A6|nr:hypothetical protein [Sphingopyxis sp. 113P3]
MDDFAKAVARFDAIDRGLDRAGVMLGNSTSTPELRNAIERAHQTHKNLADLHENLNRHLDRILGSRPEKDDELSQVGVGPDGEMDALRNVLSDIDDVAYRIRYQVERLARL